MLKLSTLLRSTLSSVMLSLLLAAERTLRHTPTGI